MESAFRGIVLRRTNQGESDRRLTLMTLERGKIDVVAKGSRKAPGRLSAVTEPLSVATFSIAEGKRTRFLTQAVPESAYVHLRQDFLRLSAAIATAELFSAMLPYEQPDPSAFALLETTLNGIDRSSNCLAGALWGQVHLLIEAGFAPDWYRSALSAAEITEVDPWFSVAAGGLVTATERDDRTSYRIPSEVLFGIRRLSEISAPPDKLRRAAETQFALAPWWRHVADMPLAAFESLINLLNADLNQPLAM
jgi:DNA repair protein RecO (recombination protein O)